METQVLRSAKAVPVREHRFGSGHEYTVGVEEELMLVDRGDLALAAGVEQVLAASHDDRIKAELMQCQVEVATTPHRTAASALDDLLDLRARVIRIAERGGFAVAASGTHPFSYAESQALTVRDRYRELVAALRYPLRREVCFGMHVHVAVGGADKALRVIEALLEDLPLLLALSTSSPFWRGEATGLRSTRTVVFQSLPRSGLPPAFDDYEGFARGIEVMQRANALPDHSHLWWDVRPHPRFGTIEIRCLDVQPRARDSAALAGLIQALVRHYGRRYDLGERFPDADRFIVGENRWLAARFGLQAPLVDARAESAVQARRAVHELLDRVSEDAAELEATPALERIEEIVRDGTSADRQLALHRRGQSLVTIVQSLAGETAALE